MVTEWSKPGAVGVFVLAHEDHEPGEGNPDWNSPWVPDFNATTLVVSVCIPVPYVLHCRDSLEVGRGTSYGILHCPND